MNYIQNFKSDDDIIENYDAPQDALEGATIHLAWYGYGDYSGASLVVFEKNGKLYEVNGSHCSCFGLEGQWAPEETSWDAIRMRDYWSMCDDYAGGLEAKELLSALLAVGKVPKVIAIQDGRLFRED